jgi:hypothetical protein
MVAAVEPLGAVAQQQQGPADAFIQRGEQALSAGDVAVATDLLSHAVDLDPDNPLAHFLLGRALLRGTPPATDQAKEQLETATRLAPSSEAGVEAFVELSKLKRAEAQAAADQKQREAEAANARAVAERERVAAENARAVAENARNSRIRNAARIAQRYISSGSHVDEYFRMDNQCYQHGLKKINSITLPNLAQDDGTIVLDQSNGVLFIETIMNWMEAMGAGFGNNKKEYFDSHEIDWDKTVTTQLDDGVQLAFFDRAGHFFELIIGDSGASVGLSRAGGCGREFNFMTD